MQSIGEIEGNWLVNGKWDCETYSGELTIKRTDEVYDCEWHLENGETYQGTGIVYTNRLLVARKQGNERPGVVLYVLDAGDALSAVWNHPDINYRLGTGLTTQPEHPTLENTRVISYYGPDGVPSQPLRLDITRNDTVYALSWSGGEKPLAGIGLPLNKARALGAAWNSGDGVLEFLSFVLRGDEMKAHWARTGSNRIGEESACFRGC